MQQSRARRRLVVSIFAVISAATAMALIAPLVTPGYDTSFALAWGRDLDRGLALDFSHPSSPTPHPLALLAGAGLGLTPVGWAAYAAGCVVAAGWLTMLITLSLITFDMTASRVSVGAAVTSAAASAPLGLLVLGASSDVIYCALGLTAVYLTIRGWLPAAIAVFMVAALLRPEAVLLALVPLTIAIKTAGGKGPQSASLRFRQAFSAWAFGGGLVFAIAAWLATGAAGGDPLVGLHSASTNAEVNHNIRGPIEALTNVVPGLAGPTGWATFGAAAIAAITAIPTVMARLVRPLSPRSPRHHTPPFGYIPTAMGGQKRAAIVIESFIGVAIVAYLGEGLLGTPLVARYLLLPALLCVTLAALCIPMAAQLIRSTRASRSTGMIVAVVLVAGSTLANLSAWQDVSHARKLRGEAFASAFELLDTDLAQHCAAPIAVRSPALVALTSLTLNRPLRDITVSDRASAGILLQPLTRESMELAGYGPMTSFKQQEVFPTDAPPRQSNRNWALYSRCEP